MGRNPKPVSPRLGIPRRPCWAAFRGWVNLLNILRGARLRPLGSGAGAPRCSAVVQRQTRCGLAGRGNPGVVSTRFARTDDAVRRRCKAKRLNAAAPGSESGAGIAGAAAPTPLSARRRQGRLTAPRRQSARGRPSGPRRCTRQAARCAGRRSPTGLCSRRQAARYGDPQALTGAATGRQPPMSLPGFGSPR